MMVKVVKGFLLSLFVSSLFLTGIKGINGGWMMLPSKVLILMAFGSLLLYYLVKYASFIMRMVKYPFVYVFIFTIFIAAGLLAAGIGVSRETNENRRLTPFPQVPANPSQLKRFPGKFEKALNDNFPFRSFFVRINSDFSLRYHKKSPNKMLVVGKSNYLFFTGDKSLDDYCGAIKLTDEQLSKFIEKISKINNFLKQRKIPFLYVIAADKQTIYPEYMPDKYKQSNQHRADQVIAGISDAGIEYLDLRKTLLLSKSAMRYPLYYYNDSHWNMFGGFLGFNAIQKRLGEDEIPFDSIEFSSRSNAFDLELTKKLLNLTNISEKEYFLSGIKGKDFSIPDKWEITKVREYKNEKSLSKKKILFFCDSFIIEMSPFFYSYYNEFKFVNDGKYGVDEKIIEEFKPDYVVFENLERRILYTINENK